MFNHPADFKLPPKEKQAITEFYTTAEIIENSMLANHGYL